MGTHPIFESDFDCLTECCLDSPPDPPAHWLPHQSKFMVSLAHMLLLPIPLPSPPDKRKLSQQICLCCQPFSKRNLLNPTSQIHLLTRVRNWLLLNQLLVQLVSLTSL